MEDDGLNMRNWGYYEPSFREHLGLQLMSPIPDTKPFLSTRENSIMMNPNPTTNHHHIPNYPPSDPSIPIHYMRDNWIQRERFLHILPGNHNFPVIPTASTSLVMPSLHIAPPPPLDLSKDTVTTMEDSVVDRKDSVNVNGGDGDRGSSVKKRGSTTTTAAAGGKPPRAKKQKKTPSTPKENGNSSSQRPKTMKRSMDVVINGIDMDISGIPIPVCSCTGASQQCYRWGSGGWQSACCTTTISMHPLPMSTKRRGARIAGRKMSRGAFKKVLEKLASEGYNFANAIDLRTFWAKHGTNKFVTIR